MCRGTWFQLPGIPNFNVCEKCYEMHIYETPFREEFDAVEASGPTYCAFNTPRILSIIWPQVVRTGRFDVFRGHAAERSRISTCSLSAGTKSGLWYMVLRPDGSCSFIACQACFQDVILASPYHPHFKEVPAAVAEGAYSCHVSTPFIEAQLAAGKLPWHAVLREVEYRIHEVLPCPGNKIVPSPGRRWWKPRDSDLIAVCDSCYCDGIAPSQFADHFTSVIQKASDVGPWFCGMGGFALSVVWTHAVEKDDYALWLEAVSAAYSHPMCTPDGTIGGVWNVFREPGLGEFYVCDRCAEMYVRPLGFGESLDRLRFSPDAGRMVCGLNPEGPRAAEFREKLGEAAGWRDIEVFREGIVNGAMPRPPPCCRRVRERRR